MKTCGLEQMGAVARAAVLVAMTCGCSDSGSNGPATAPAAMAPGVSSNVGAASPVAGQTSTVAGSGDTAASAAGAGPMMMPGIAAQGSAGGFAAAPTTETGSAGAGSAGAGTAGAGHAQNPEIATGGASATTMADGGVANGMVGQVDAAAIGPSEPVCSSTADELVPGTTQETIDVGGVSRTFWLKVPAGYDPSKPTPLIVEFHGLGLDGNTMRTVFSTFEDVSERENLIVAWPDGLDKAWNVGPCCTEERTVDDVGFARALVDEVASRGCVDRKRVYATGYSNGGGMTYTVACQAADVFAAAAPAAFDMVRGVDCEPSRPLTVVAFRGENDPIVLPMPHESDPPTELTSGFNLPPIYFLGPEPTFEKWAELDGCSGEPVTDGDGCRTYEECSEGVQVTLCLSPTGGHDPADAGRVWDVLQNYTLP